MEKAIVVACGAYLDNGYGCPGEWRCLKAAAMGDGKFNDPTQVIGFVKCECPGRPTVSNVGMTIKLGEIKPDVIYLSSCMANAKPGCPYTAPEDMAKMIEDKTGVKVVLGTHDYA